MSRWIIALLVLVLASVAAPTSARAVRIQIITVANQCPSAPSWKTLSACFAAHGWKALSRRDWPHAKLFDFGKVPPGEQYGVQPAVVLYTETRNGWQVGGYFSVADTGYRVSDARPITINHTDGYRIEIGTRQQSAGWIELQDRVLFCSGLSPDCTVVETACEVVEEGHLVSAFHGAIELSGRKLHVSGDTRLAGGVCAPSVIDETFTWP